MNFKVIIWVVIIVLLVLGASLALIVFENRGPVSPRPTTQNPPSVQNKITFDVPLTITVGKHAVFNDGLQITLDQINDSRCKQGVVCVWAGELSPVFGVEYPAEGVQPGQITLGLVTAPSITRNSYTFTLNSATETSAVITVSKSGHWAACYVGGCSGEICSDQQGVVSSCVYNAKFVCYKNAACERQASGQCGWTQTAALTTCLNSTH